MELTVCGTLTTKSFDALLRRSLSTQSWNDTCSDAVVVDLSACTFIEAPSAATLCALVYHLSGGKRDVHCRPPDRFDVRRYFEQCGLAHAVSARGVGAPAGELQAVGNYVLPVCRVAGAHDVAVIGDFVHRSVGAWLQASADLASRSRSVFDALCENVVVHAAAGMGAWAAAQVHRAGDGRGFLRIGVADVGVGIPVTMSRMRPELVGASPEKHCAAILAATEPGVTGSETGGGIGLAQVRQLVRDCRGTIHIRSLTGYVTIGIYPTRAVGVCHFPGTQLEVMLFS